MDVWNLGTPAPANYAAMMAVILIVAMGIKGIKYSECVQKYLDYGVTVIERLRSSMYSKRILEALGIEGAIRVSPLHCNSTEDIDEFLRITKKIAESV